MSGAIKEQAPSVSTGPKGILPEYDYAKNGGSSLQHEPLDGAHITPPSFLEQHANTGKAGIDEPKKTNTPPNSSFLSKSVNHLSPTAKISTTSKMSDATATTVGTMTGDRWNPDVGEDKPDTDAGSGD